MLSDLAPLFFDIFLHSSLLMKKVFSQISKCQITPNRNIQIHQDKKLAFPSPPPPPPRRGRGRGRGGGGVEGSAREALASLKLVIPARLVSDSQRSPASVSSVLGLKLWQPHQALAFSFHTGNVFGIITKANEDSDILFRSLNFPGFHLKQLLQHMTK